MSRHLDAHGPVDLVPLPAAAVVQGRPTAGSRVLTDVGGAEVGVWVMTPGTATDVESDEVFVVLEGTATLTFEGGGLVEVEPGSVVRLHEGERTTWTVHTTLRKVYVA